MSEMMHWLSPKVRELLQDQRVNCRKICSQTWTGHAEESEWRKSSALEPGFQCEWMRSNSTTLGLNQNSLSKMPFIYHHSVNTEERQTIFTPLTHLPMDSFIINPAFTSPHQPPSTLVSWDSWSSTCLVGEFTEKVLSHSCDCLFRVYKQSRHFTHLAFHLHHVFEDEVCHHHSGRLPDALTGVPQPDRSTQLPQKAAEPL